MSHSKVPERVFVKLIALAGAILVPATLFGMVSLIPVQPVQAQSSAQLHAPDAEVHLDPLLVSDHVSYRVIRAEIVHETRRAVITVPEADIPEVKSYPKKLAERPEHQAVVPAAVSSHQEEALAKLIMSVRTGEADIITGVYVPGTLSLPVLQQPASQPGYVSPMKDIITQFSLASQYGTIGLLAHNDLAGAQFSQFSIGQEVFIVYGNGTVQEYSITEIRRFQAKKPNSPFSDFIDLDHENTELTVEDLFFQIYQGEGRVVFQTCIEQDKSSTWGRLFIIATNGTTPKHIREIHR